MYALSVDGRVATVSPSLPPRTWQSPSTPPPSPATLPPLQLALPGMSLGKAWQLLSVCGGDASACGAAHSRGQDGEKCYYARVCPRVEEM